MPTLNILAGGAAQGLVKALEAQFGAVSGYAIDGVFGAVGAMRDKLAKGHPTDVVILTSAIIAALAADGLVSDDSIVDLGGVETAIAVRDGDATPCLSNSGFLREALLASDAVYIPDPELSTAGVHFAKVIGMLGIAPELQPRLRAFPNGATAMAALASAEEARPMGCTQATEILATPGVRLVESLPAGLDLTTLYTAGIIASGAHREAGMMLLDLLASDRNRLLRNQCGFV